MKRFITQNYKIIVFLALSISIVLLGFKATELDNQVQKYSETQQQVNILLSGENRAPGYTCGVLTEKRAQEILQATVEKEFIQGPTDTIEVGKPTQPSLFWNDSCRYKDDKNSGRYVEFYMSTFATKEIAKDAFPDFLKTVNDNQVLDSSPYGQELVYDGGVYYLLRDNRIIQVSASNGDPSEVKEFSRATFESFLASMQ